MDRAIIVDLDGTLCDCEHRVHHVQRKIKTGSLLMIRW